MKVFISYSHDDRNLALRLVNDLREQNVEVFLDTDMISPGDKWANVLSHYIELSDVILLLISKSTSKSDFQSSEIAFALSSSIANQSQKIIPILLDKQASVPFFLKDRIYCDFTIDSKYQENFRYLLEALLKESTVKNESQEEIARQIEAIKYQKELLTQLKKQIDTRRSKRIFMLIGALSSILASLASIFLVSITSDRLITFSNILYERKEFVLGIVTGVASLAVSLFIVRLAHRRSIDREEDDANK